MPAVPADDTTQLDMTTVGTRSYPSEADGKGEPGDEPTTPRPTATRTPVAAGTEKITWSVGTEGVRQNVTVRGGQGSDPMADAMGSEVAPAGSTERLTSARVLGHLSQITPGPF